MKDIFTYEIHKGDWISSWMLSSVKGEHYISEPVPYPAAYRVNMPWSEAVSPVRRQFTKERSFEKEKSELPECSEVYVPFETDKVERSGFWKLPTNVTFGARLEVEAPQSGEYSFHLVTCGGAKVFANGEQQAEFYSYLRNEAKETDISLTLKKGKNILYVLVNDLAERDTQLFFKLGYNGEEVLTANLPGTVDLDCLNRTRKLLQGIYLKKFSFRNREIVLYFQEPVEDVLTADIELAFTDAHAPAVSRQKSVVLTPGMHEISIGDLIARRMGMVNAAIRIKIGDVSLNRTLNFEYYDETVMPKSDIGTIAERKQTAVAFAAEYGLDNLNRVLALRKAGVHEEAVKTIWDRELSCIRQREDCADFRLPALLHAYHASYFTEEEKQEIKRVLLDFRYWFDEPGNDVMWFFSENHALLFHAAEYLAGELFEKEIFTNSQVTGAVHKERAGQRLRAWFEEFLTNGFNEWNSPVYIPIDMIGFFVLYDLTTDSDMRDLAKKALDRAFSTLAVNSYQGAVASSYGRIYFKNLIGRRTGEAAALNFIASGEGYLCQHTFATVMFALSDYEPSREIMDMYHISEEGRVTETVEGEEKVHLYSYKTPDFIMGSVLDYHPGECGLQEHVLQVMIKDCDTQIWINHPGESVYFGSGRPGYFAGNGTLPLVRQEKNRATVEFHLQDQEVSYTHAFCPLEQFSEVSLEGSWLYLKKDNVYVAVYAHNGIQITTEGPLKNYELISPGKDNVWKVIVEEGTAYANLMGFKKFINKMEVTK